ALQECAAVAGRSKERLCEERNIPELVSFPREPEVRNSAPLIGGENPLKTKPSRGVSFLCQGSTMHCKDFARELVEKQCGTHSFGLIHGFLLKAGYDANEAEAEFVRFLSGQLPARLLQAVRSWVAEEKRDNPTIPISEAPAANNSSALPSDSRELLPA